MANTAPTRVLGFCNLVFTRALPWHIDLRAPEDVCHTVQQLRQVIDLITASQTCDNAADASKVLHAHHGANDAVITICSLNLQLILDCPARAGNRLCKAEEHLQQVQHTTLGANLAWHSHQCQWVATDTCPDEPHCMCPVHRLHTAPILSML